MVLWAVGLSVLSKGNWSPGEIPILTQINNFSGTSVLSQKVT